MSKLPLVIDSSSLLRDPKREKEATKALERLVAQGKVSLYLPDVIVREVVANLEADAQADLQKMEGALVGLERRVPTNVAGQNRGRLRSAFRKVKDEISGALGSEFTAWLDAIQAEVPPIEPGAGSIVMDAYFQGARPFRSARYREDIPDAFILEAIRGLATGRALHVVVADARLAEAVGLLQGVTVHRSLDKFIAFPTIQAALRSLYGTANLELLKILVSEEPELIEEDISTDYIDRIAGETIYAPGIPGDNSEATISMVDDIEDLALDWRLAEYYGDGSVAVPFTFKTSVYADSYIYKSDYYVMSDDKTEDLSITDWNEHYVQAEGEYPVQVTGLATMTLPVDVSASILTRNALAEMLPEARLKIDNVDDIEVLERDAD